MKLTATVVYSLILGSAATHILQGSATAPSTSELTQWRKYKQAFNKAYDANEEEYRRDVFLQNIARYAELNAQEPLAQYSATRRSDREPREYLSGYIDVPLPSFSPPPVLPAPPPAPAPSSKDWSWSGKYTSPIKDQGACGGCWAESAIEQVESDAMIQHGWTGVLSTQELLDCT